MVSRFNSGGSYGGVTVADKRFLGVELARTVWRSGGRGGKQ